jgi:hypothetical protein
VSEKELGGRWSVTGNNVDVVVKADQGASVTITNSLGKPPEPFYARVRLGLFHDANRNGIWDANEIPLGLEPPGQSWEVFVSLEGAPDDSIDASTGESGWTGWYVDDREDRGFVITSLPGFRVPQYRVDRGEIWQVTGYVTLRNDNGKFEKFPESLIPLPVARSDQKQLAIGIDLVEPDQPEQDQKVTFEEGTATDTVVGDVSGMLEIPSLGISMPVMQVEPVNGKISQPLGYVASYEDDYAVHNYDSPELGEELRVGDQLVANGQTLRVMNRQTMSMADAALYALDHMVLITCDSTWSMNVVFALELVSP